MIPLNTEICNFIEDHDVLNLKKVGELIGASKQGMSKFKKTGSLGFRKLLRLSFLLFPSKQSEVMSNWCLRLDSSENIKQSFEYAAITRNIKLLKSLLKKHKNEEGIIAEYVSYYNLIYRYMINKVSGFDLINELKKVRQTNDEVLTVLNDIIKCYNYYFERKVHLMLETATYVEKMIFNLSENNLFMKECFLHRVAEILELVYFFMNNKEMARHYSNIIINANVCPKTVSDASYVMGMTYLVDSPSESIRHLQNSYEISKHLGDDEIEKESRFNLDFAKIFLGIELAEDSLNELKDFQEEMSLRNLDKITEVLSDQFDEDFINLFKARTTNRPDELYKIFELFFKEGNIFFAALVANELKDILGDSFILTQFINFKLGNERIGYFEKDFIRSFSDYYSSNGAFCA